MCSLVVGCTIPSEKEPPKDIVYLPPTFTDSTDITVENILRAVYSDYKFPKGFYREEHNGGSPYYENTISIRTRSGQWFELATNSREQAFAWSESSSVKSAYYRTLESERETEKFFEFRRVWLKHPTNVLLSRVHKANYLDRSMFDRLHPGDTLAILQVRPIDTAIVKELVEYLWFYDSYNIGGSKVLYSYIIDLGMSVRYILFYTTVVYGDWGLCDQITVSRREFQLTKQTGVLTRSNADVIRSLSGQCR